MRRDVGNPDVGRKRLVQRNSPFYSWAVLRWAEVTNCFFRSAKGVVGLRPTCTVANTRNGSAIQSIVGPCSTAVRDGNPLVFLQLMRPKIPGRE